jgi:hypothetical protein
MSPRDSPLGGHLPSSTFHDIITKICSSMRAYGCLQSTKESADREGAGQGVQMQLILNPWNEGMVPAKEFRVFVPPPAARGIREPHIHGFTLSAISQYKWHSVLLPLYEFCSTGRRSCFGWSSQYISAHLCVHYNDTYCEFEELVVDVRIQFRCCAAGGWECTVGGNQSFRRDEWLRSLSLQLGG